MTTPPLVALALLACKNDEIDDDDDHDTLPAICNGGTRWEDGEVAFADATESWGLVDLNPAGTRVIAVDFDGDGWTDLAVRASDSPDDFGEGGTRTSWLLRNTGQGTFEDVTQASGIRANRLSDDPDTGRPGQAWAFADVDNDGDLDVYTGLTDLEAAYEETSEVLLNQGDGTFVLGPESGEQRETHATSPAGAAWVDADRDGNVDLWVANYYYAQDQLYVGDGTGWFEDRTKDVGLDTESWSDIDTINAGEAHTVAWSALACDLNNDGGPELLAASYGRAPNHLWLNDGGGAFSNRSVASGYAFDERTDWSDNESARCWCTLHPDDEDCEGVPEPAYIPCAEDADAFRWDHTTDREPFRLGGNSGGTTCADVDNDGWMDLLTSEIVHWDVGSSSDPSELLVNTQDPEVVFERPGNEVTGLEREHRSRYYDDGDMSGSVFDFDNDGWPDVYVGSSDYEGTRGLLFHQEAPGLFIPVPIEQGIDHTRSHGSAVADFDRDGDLDIVAGHSSARCESDCYDTFNVRLFENVTGEDVGEQGNFLAIHLEGGAGTNRAAIGAVVSVTAGGVTQTQDVDGGHGHYGQQDDLVLHFGLGAACEAEVTVRWPDAALSTESATLGGGYRYHWTQGSAPEVE